MAKNPITYVKKSGPVYVDSVFYKAGEPFTTSQPEGEGWERVSPVEVAAAEAQNPVPADVPLETLDLSALRAFAATKHVNSDGLNKKDLIAAIKAANEPAL